jgi:hypothetical protein
MKMRRALIALLVLSLGISAGCGSDDDGPFEGDWIAADGSRLLFRGSEWSDSDGDAGTFSSSGRYPEFTLVFRLGVSQFSRRAKFYDTKTFDLCTIFPDGSLDVCIKMVYDRPTLH